MDLQSGVQNREEHFWWDSCKYIKGKNLHTLKPSEVFNHQLVNENTGPELCSSRWMLRVESFLSPLIP